MNKNLYFLLLLIFILLSSCSNTVRVKLFGNKSVGDNYYSVITPEGIVREVSHKYHILLPLPGMSGNFIFKFQAVAQGEAVIVVYNRFRGDKTWQIAAYKATVDKRKKLTLMPIEDKFPLQEHPEDEQDR